jgi:multimeric flavodoxin WrbA
MKKVLGIVGSPRRNGNTHTLVSKMLDGARDGGATTDLLLLGDLTIRECDGCHACWKGRICPKADDMNAVYLRVAESDVLVFGTPVYWYGPTALMKAFIDRFAYFNCPANRPQIKGKSAILAIPFEDEDPQTAAPVVDFFERSLHYLEMDLAGQVLVPGVSDKGDALVRPDCLREAYALGRRSVA